MPKWTLKDYLYQLRRRIDEYEEDLFSNNELTAYLNEGIQKMSGDLKHEGVATLEIFDRRSIDYKELYVNEIEKTKTDIDSRDHNFAQLRSLYLGNNKLKISKMEQVEAGFDGFYLWGDTINFNSPKSGVLKAYYIKRPRFLRNLDDTTDIPERFQDIPIEYAIAKCKEKDEEYGLYDYNLNQFYLMKTEMKKAIDAESNSTGVSELNITDYNE